MSIKISGMKLLVNFWRIKEISSLLVCFAFIFRHMLTFFRYIEVYFTLGFWTVFVITRISLYRGPLY